MSAYATAFSTITAKFAGTCKRCNGPIAAGQTIRYGGKGRTYHLASVCGVRSLMPDDAPIADQAPTPTPIATPQQLMSATIAASLAQTFTGLLAQPARIGDIETRATQTAPDQADQTDTPQLTRPTAPTFTRPTAPTTRRRKALAWAPPASLAPMSADDLL